MQLLHASVLSTQIISAAALEHLKDDVNNHFVGVISTQIQSIHSKCPRVPNDGGIRVSNQTRLSTYMHELIEKFEQHEVSRFIHFLLQFTFIFH